MADPTDESTALLQQLIRNRCVNDGSADSGNEHRSVATLAGYFGRAGRVFEPHPGRQSVLYRVPGTDPAAPRLLLLGHLDVVPAAPEGWEHDPFGGEVSEGMIWGRGAVDMLNLTAAFAVVFRAYLDGDVAPLAGDLMFCGVADEEAGGRWGARYLTEHHWDEIRCDYLLNEVAYPALQRGGRRVQPVNVAEKGPFWRRVEVQGSPGHGSQPYGSDNALRRLIAALARLEETPISPVAGGVWRDFVAALYPPGEAVDLVDPELLDATISRIAAEDPLWARYVHACTHLTISPTVLRAGDKTNVIPREAVAELDVRALPGQDGAFVDDLLRHALGEDCMLSPLIEHAAGSSPAHGPLWEAVGAALAQSPGSPIPVPVLTPVTTDMRFFRDRGATGYGVGVYDDATRFGEFAAMFHGRNERVSTASLRETVTFVSNLIEQFKRHSAG